MTERAFRSLAATERAFESLRVTERAFRSLEVTESAVRSENPGPAYAVSWMVTTNGVSSDARSAATSAELSGGMET